MKNRGTIKRRIGKKQDKFISLIADKFSIALVLEELKQQFQNL